MYPFSVNLPSLLENLRSSQSSESIQQSPFQNPSFSPSSTCKRSLIRGVLVWRSLSLLGSSFSFASYRPTGSSRLSNRCFHPSGSHRRHSTTSWSELSLLGELRVDRFAAVRFEIAVLQQCAVVSSANWDFLTFQGFTENTIIELEGDFRVVLGRIWVCRFHWMEEMGGILWKNGGEKPCGSQEESTVLSGIGWTGYHTVESDFLCDKLFLWKGGRSAPDRGGGWIEG